MCVEDVVRGMLSQGSRLAMLGFYYGVVLCYVFLTKLEYIASGPLHIMSCIASELFQDTLTERELEVFQEGVSQGVVAVLSCPLFYKRELRTLFLARTLERIKSWGTSLYVEIVVPRLRRSDLDLLRRIVSRCDQGRVIPYMRVDPMEDPSMFMRRLGLVAYFGYVFVPISPRIPELSCD